MHALDVLVGLPFVQLDATSQNPSAGFFQLVVHVAASAVDASGTTANSASTAPQAIDRTTRPMRPPLITGPGQIAGPTCQTITCSHGAQGCKPSRHDQL